VTNLLWLACCDWSCSLVALQPAKYGTLEIVDAERRLLANALLDPRNTHFALVCESTVPLFTLPFVHQYLTSVNTSYLMNFPSTGMRWTDHFLPLIPRAQWAKGGAWFTLQRRHATMVVADIEVLPVLSWAQEPACPRPLTSTTTRRCCTIKTLRGW